MNIYICAEATHGEGRCRLENKHNELKELLLHLSRYTSYSIHLCYNNIDYSHIDVVFEDSFLVIES